MGRARDLSMGKRSRNAPALTGQWTRLRRMLAKEDVDAAELRALLEALEALPGRQRYAEGALLLDGWERYRELTGTDHGRKRGTF